MSRRDTGDIKDFWEKSPLCSSMVAAEPGTAGFFREYDRLREEIESPEASYRLQEYRDFKGKRVLDVGCGNGYVISRYALEGADAYGVDITERAINITGKRLEYMGLKANLAVMDAQELRFPDDYFDCVSSMGVLHHVPDTQRAIDEIHRVLKPGGRLILMFYYRNSAYYQVAVPLIALATRKTRQQVLNEFDGVGNPLGKVYSKSEVRDMLSGFEEIEFRAHFLMPEHILPRLGSYVIPRALIKLIEPHFGFFLNIKVRKPGGRHADPGR